MKINAILNINNLTIEGVEKVIKNTSKNEVEISFEGNIHIRVNEINPQTEQGSNVLTLLNKMPIIQAKIVS